LEQRRTWSDQVAVNRRASPVARRGSSLFVFLGMLSRAGAQGQRNQGLANDIRRWEKILGPLKPHSRGAGNRKGVWFDDLIRAGRKKLKGDSSDADHLDAGFSEELPAETDSGITRGGGLE